MARSNLVDIPGHVLHETEKAYRFEPMNVGEAVWLPKSQCQWDADDRTMTMEEWLAKDKGLW